MWVDFLKASSIPGAIGRGGLVSTLQGILACRGRSVGWVTSFFRIVVSYFGVSFFGICRGLSSCSA